MMAAKPVLWACNASNDIISEAQCGFTVMADDINALETRLFKMYSMPSQALVEMGRKGRDYITAHYTYRLLTRKFIQAIEGEQ